LALTSMENAAHASCMVAVVADSSETRSGTRAIVAQDLSCLSFNDCPDRRGIGYTREGDAADSSVHSTRRSCHSRVRPRRTVGHV
jgi:hypothetical protein